LIGVTSLLLPGLPWHYFFDFFDAPLPALAVPGFFGGALFSIVLGIAARHRRFDELSLGRFFMWGALGGLALSLVPAALVAVGLATLRPDLGAWGITAIISGPLTLLSAVSASGSLLLARNAANRNAVQAGEAQDRLGSGDLSLGGLPVARSGERPRAAGASSQSDL
jgi:hypothetical protein